MGVIRVVLEVMSFLFVGFSDLVAFVVRLVGIRWKGGKKVLTMHICFSFWLFVELVVTRRVCVR